MPVLLRKRVTASHGGWILQLRHEASTVHRVRDFRTSQLKYRRRDIDAADHSRTNTSRFDELRIADYERRLDPAVVHRGLIPGKRTSVVTEEQHKRVVGQALRIELCHY